jgi:hypothetical protein
MVCWGFGTREIRARAVENRHRPIVGGALTLDNVLKHFERRIESNLMDDLAIPDHRYADGHDASSADGEDEQVGIGRLSRPEDSLDGFHIAPPRRRLPRWNAGVQDLRVVLICERNE